MGRGGNALIGTMQKPGTQRSPLPMLELDSAVRAEVERLLLEAEVWDLHTYGWVDAETADPEFIGHAMWQTDPPVDVHERLFSGKRFRKSEPAPPISNWQRLLAVSGADFDGLMQAARMSIGLFLFHATFLREFQFHDEKYFDLHWMSSIIYLATASERLREFFISAVFRKSQTAYKRGVFLRQDRGLYPTPFLEAKERLRVPELTDALAKACPLAEEIRRLRGSRNEIVHEIATAMGRRERQIIDERPQFADPGDFDFPSFKNAIAEGEALHRQRLDETIKRLGDWYALLARASNEAFIVENRLRKYTDIPLIPWGL